MAKKDPKYQERIRGNWKAVKPEDVAKKEPLLRISFEHTDPGGDFCLSDCEKGDVKQAVGCFKRLTAMTWAQVYGTATKERGQKTGLHWTAYNDEALNVGRPAWVAEDHQIAGIRAGEKFRIFGFRFDEYFHVIWFDPEHLICDG